MGLLLSLQHRAEYEYRGCKGDLVKMNFTIMSYNFNSTNNFGSLEQDLRGDLIITGDD